MINKTKKFVFIHVPKCGGSSIQKCNYFNCWSGSSHLTLENYHKLIFNSNSYKYYSIVRNPWSRMLSVYTYWKQMTPNHKYYRFDKEACKVIQDNDMSFKEFIVKLLEPKVYFHIVGDPNKEMVHLRSQYSFFTVGGQYKMDFVGRMENLQEDFDFICEDIGIPRQELPHVNKSSHKQYTEYYDDETIDVISKVYKDDIERFNYKFGE
ncbi:MAG: sulfotransferase family 2 domain-containing protein [Wenyingzhuangia sp.]|uniref:sulfotransferase family 2 domain-containing protein n=1 Tax=Wenyingzhuangia sp. TaxID=1964193 RepID=UPI0032194248